MSANSSSSSNVSLHLPPFYFFSDCFDSRIGSFIFTAFTVASILLLLPLSIVVLRLGHQRRRQQQQRRSASSSPTNYITYHMVVMEMLCVLGSIFYCIGFYVDLQTMMRVASHLFFVASSGQILFHTLTCVECYLAVVQPVTYLHLKKGSRGRTRNTIMWSVWLLSFAEMSFTALITVDIIVAVAVVQQSLSLAVVSFCSVAVLRVLKRPGPREGGGDRERADPSKQRALGTISAILGALLLRFVGCLVCTALYASPLISSGDRCVVIESTFWFCLPGSLVLPLLFLHRAGRLPCCRSNTEAGHASS